VAKAEGEELDPAVMAEVTARFEKAVGRSVIKQREFGAIRFAADVKLARNALIDAFDLVVKAAPAKQVRAADVAQVRTIAPEPAVGNKGVSVVIDFGTPRTVSKVAIDAPFGIRSVRIWNGAQLVDPPLFTATANSPVFARDILGLASTQEAVLASEPRTERLAVTVLLPAGSDEDDPIAALVLELPDAPSDLELRIDGQAPVWTHTGPVPVTGAQAEEAELDEVLSDTAWSPSGRRIVKLGSALAALTGDPEASGEQTFRLELTSRAPGLLKIEERLRSTRLIRRGTLEGRSETTLTFDDEGLALLALGAPGLAPETEILEARLRVEGKLSAERTVPAVGPDVFEVVDLRLDSEHAALLRLQASTGLASLQVVRIPLVAGDEGAEARVVLWQNKDAGLAEPTSVIDGGTSVPVTLPPGGAESWWSFELPAPIEIDDDDPPWAALVVTRGQVLLSLASPPAEPGALDAQVLRLGPQSGPWSLLPNALREGELSVRARARSRGLAPKEQPLAPLLLSLESGPESGVDPGPRGGEFVIQGGAGARSVLRVVSSATGTVTLRNVDLITRD
jgi:hypothetical protein